MQLILDLAIPGGADGRSTRQATPTGHLGGRQRDSRTVGGSAAGGQIVSWRRDRPLRRFTPNQHSGRLALGIYEVRAERFPDRLRGSHDHDAAAVARYRRSVPLAGWSSRRMSNGSRRCFSTTSTCSAGMSSPSRIRSGRGACGRSGTPMSWMSWQRDGPCAGFLFHC